MRTSGEAIPPPIDLWQQGIDFLAAAELILRDEQRMIVDAAVLNAVFATRLLLRTALGDGAPDDPNLSLADLFSRLDADAQTGILGHAGPWRGVDEPLPHKVLAQTMTWLEWHEFLEGPKGSSDRAEFTIHLARAVELWTIEGNPGLAGRNPYRNSGPLARSRPLDQTDE